MADDGQLSDKLVRLIHDYQEQVSAFVSALRHHYDVEDVFEVRRQLNQQRGKLDDRNETHFYFHGVGCWFTAGRGEVDFDFGPDQRHDGFDGWRLWLYAKSLPNEFPEFQRLEIVESVLGELVTDGVVHRPHWMPSPQLCYFKIAADV